MRALTLLACLGLVACSAETSSDPAVVSGAPAAAPAAPSTQDGDRAAATGAAFAVPLEHDQASGFVCRKGAFCEDFEEQGFAARWSGAFTTGDGTLERNTDSASLGRGSLRLFSKDEASTAYLLQEKGAVAGTWSGALGFAFRVEELPASYLGGPELTVKTADGPLTIRVSISPEGVFVEQSATAECLRDRCTSSRTRIAAAIPNHWYAIRLGLEVNAHDAAPYGRLEASIDDGGLVSVDLGVPFYEGSLFLSAGITKGDAGHRAIADLDDLSLLVR